MIKYHIRVETFPKNKEIQIVQWHEDGSLGNTARKLFLETPPKFSKEVFVSQYKGEARMRFEQLRAALELSADVQTFLNCSFIK